MHIYLSFILFIGLAFSNSDVKYQDYERKKGYEEILFDLLDNESTLPELKNLMGEQVYIRMFEDLEKLRKKYSEIRFQKDTIIIKKIPLNEPKIEEGWLDAFYDDDNYERYKAVMIKAKFQQNDYLYAVFLKKAEDLKEQYKSSYTKTHRIEREKKSLPVILKADNVYDLDGNRNTYKITLTGKNTCRAKAGKSKKTYNGTYKAITSYRDLVYGFSELEFKFKELNTFSRRSGIPERMYDKALVSDKINNIMDEYIVRKRIDTIYEERKRVRITYINSLRKDLKNWKSKYFENSLEEAKIYEDQFDKYINENKKLMKYIRKIKKSYRKDRSDIELFHSLMMSLSNWYLPTDPFSYVPASEIKNFDKYIKKIRKNDESQALNGVFFAWTYWRNLKSKTLYGNQTLSYLDEIRGSPRYKSFTFYTGIETYNDIKKDLQSKNDKMALLLDAILLKYDFPAFPEQEIFKSPINEHGIWSEKEIQYFDELRSHTHNKKLNINSIQKSNSYDNNLGGGANSQHNVDKISREEKQMSEIAKRYQRRLDRKDNITDNQHNIDKQSKEEKEMSDAAKRYQRKLDRKDNMNDLTNLCSLNPDFGEVILEYIIKKGHSVSLPPKVLIDLANEANKSKFNFSREITPEYIEELMEKRLSIRD